MKILVISDLHNRIYFVEELIDFVKPDFTVFLGDYFDSKKNDSLELTEKTSLWLKQSIKNKNRWHLIGNHDAHYFFPKNSEIRIKGFSKEKLKLIHSILTVDEIDNCFNLVYFAGAWTLSHAGFHPDLFDDIPDQRQIAKLCDDALPQLKLGKVPKIVNYWNPHVQGCLLLHWSNFEIIYGIKQMVGHSFHNDVSYQFDNVDLDTGNKHYAIIENDEVSIYENKFI